MTPKRFGFGPVMNSELTLRSSALPVSNSYSKR